MMMEMHSLGKTMEEVAECLKLAPIHPNMISAIKSAYNSGCDLRILSDANTFFIETILKHHGLMDCFSEINTNPSFVDESGRLRILPYHDFNSSCHGCSICPPNMCKGMVIERIRASVSAERKKRFIYLGDGAADFCAGLKLNEEDCFMPRKNFPIWELIQTNPILVKSGIHEWSDWDELRTKLLNLTDTIIVEEKCCNLGSEELVPPDCKFHTSSMSTTHETFSHVLPVPH
ncbi:inorganic pyrophosphatase 3 [Tripterygium wilfordii]|uniref:Inorganic pyrophosphatase 3 n=2 Tax=Tripterygium wilfordii TaxID=458696 RepID=A0A7J7DPV1_TRIWF|nr:inorganic pyrophosphatase 3 [Tripterygium wilfordii]